MIAAFYSTLLKRTMTQRPIYDSITRKVREKLLTRIDN